MVGCMVHMAARAETVEIESQRAELESVLRSQEFVRAPRLAHLLSYLCEKLFAGEANQIKEYSIALEAFNRRDTFDQDSDSIVRVEANRLRKRLAEDDAARILPCSADHDPGRSICSAIRGSEDSARGCGEAWPDLPMNGEANRVRAG